MSAQLAATGGSGSYSWAIASGSLPAGLSLSTSGIISGTPSSSANTTDVTVRVTDTSSPQQQDVATLSIGVEAQGEGTSSAALYSYSIQTTSGGKGYDAAGNVIADADSVNGSWSFAYDSLNRLATASGSQADNPYPNYCWQYDSFGNRLAQTSASSAYDSTQYGGANSCPASTGTSSWALYNSSNQMTSTSQNLSQGQYYDAAGNVTFDGVNSYLYDGEGHICAVANTPIAGLTTMTQYLYDAEGNRVAKGTISSFSCDTTTNGFTVATVYVLGPGNEQLSEIANNAGTWQWAHTNVYAAGQLMATYDADLSGHTDGALHFHLSDWLGTRRQQTDYTGNPVLNFLSQPYGDGLTTIPVSTTDAADATEHHFTGKERDTESGNDYFEARYYGSNFGRFLTPDWSAKVEPVPYAKMDNPQSLNLYVYVLNNPLRSFDADGHEGADGQNGSGLNGGSSCPDPQNNPCNVDQKKQSDLQKSTDLSAAQQQDGSATARATEAAESVTNFAMAKVKFDAAIAAGSASETGVGAVGAAYLAISAAGSGTAATVQALGAATGWTKTTETGAEAVATITSVSGAGTLLVTGNMNKAATAAAWEGIVTSNPKDLATGGTLSRAAHAADLLQNIHTVQNSVVNAAKSAFNSYVNFAQQYF
ncbi:RHS repeat-associated core domain-containing protein [Telmatobacter bradus]|uniref:RHS repeat-associated core domain-containing protein n=1 Tax=Telmatobacter bradus TaxID=474953 RepID=UPI003B438E25